MLGVMTEFYPFSDHREEMTANCNSRPTFIAFSGFQYVFIMRMDAQS